MAVGAVGTVILAYLGYVRLLVGDDIGNRPILMLGILLMVLGVQMVTTGLVADMVMRTYHESQKKPIYFVREHLGGESQSHEENKELVEN